MQFEPIDTLAAGKVAARWQLDPARGEVSYQPGWAHWLGFGDDADVGATRFWRSRVHPDDLSPMLGALNAYIEGWHAAYESRFRLLDGQGVYRLMFSRGVSAQRDASGRVRSIRGVLEDLSREPSAGWAAAPVPVLPEQHLQTLQVAPVGLLRVEHGLVRWANAAFCDLVGVPAARLVGRPVARLFCGSMPPTGSVEIELLQFDGRRRWVQLSGSRVPGQGDAVVLACTDVTGLRARCDTAEHLASHDPLTGLANRRLLQLRLEQALGMARRERQRVALAYLDLDHFKRVNDTLGHAVGDQLLAVLGRRMQSSVRPQDTVARIGGDEFVVLLAGLDDETEAEAVLRRLMAEVGREVEVGIATSLRVSLSAGLVISDPGCVAAADLLSRADRTMFAAKQERDRLLVLRTED